MDGQDHFLSCDPKVELVWPPLLVSMRVTQKVRGCADLFKFWGLMAEAFGGVPESDLREKQGSMVAERIVGLTKTDDMEAQLQKLFPLDMKFAECVCSALVEQVREVHSIIWCTATPVKQLSALVVTLAVAVRNSAVEDNVITSALSVFPAGRELVTKAKLFGTRAGCMLSDARLASSFIENSLAALEER